MAIILLMVRKWGSPSRPFRFDEQGRSDANSSNSQANFYYGFKHINDTGATTISFKPNATKKVESAMYPTGAVQLLAPPLVDLQVHPSQYINFCQGSNWFLQFGSSFGSVSVWGSTDNSTWTMLLDNPTPQGGSYLTYFDNLPAHLIGSEEVFCKFVPNHWKHEHSCPICREWAQRYLNFLCGCELFCSIRYQ